jgi:hypothetical protein
MKKTHYAGLLALGGFVAASGSAYATMPMQKKAKDAGFPVTGCAYCHVDKLPKKGAAALNDRGKWLIAEKERRKAAEVDVAWLKEYVEPAAK